MLACQRRLDIYNKAVTLFLMKTSQFKLGEVVIAHTLTSVYIGKVVNIGQGFGGKNNQLVTIESIDGKRNIVAGGYCRQLTHEDIKQLQAKELEAVNDKWNSVRAMLVT